MSLSGYAIWVKLKATDSGQFCRVTRDGNPTLWAGESPQDAVECLAVRYPGVYDETDTFIVREAGFSSSRSLVIVKLERNFRAVVQP